MKVAGSLSTQNLEAIINTRQPNSQQTTTGERTEERKNIINSLFGYLKAAYPNFLTNQDEIPAKRIWYVQLEKYSGDQIKAALNVSIDKHPTFAPTIGEFKAILTETRIVKPGQMIEMAPICQNCHSLRNTQHHQDNCGGNK